MLEKRAHNYDIPDLVHGWPIHASACFDESADDFVADIAALHVRHNAQVI